MGEIHPAPRQFSSAQVEADPVLRFFHYAHLPPQLQAVSSVFCGLAVFIVENLPRNAERTKALNKLLEAKDAAVRANVEAPVENFSTRLVAEHAELTSRLDKLTAFIDGPTFSGIEEPQRRLLIEQRAHMDNYRSVLDERMSNLGIVEAPGFAEAIETDTGGRGVITGPATGDSDPPFE
jgi:hypothetical protein